MRRDLDSHEHPKPRGRKYEPPPPIPTLADLANQEWFWVYCNNYYCSHRKATKLAPLIEKFGGDTSSDKIRRDSRCTKCGHKGATLIGRSHINSLVGEEPFPREPF
jgi:hypothetical protein